MKKNKHPYFLKFFILPTAFLPLIFLFTIAGAQNNFAVHKITTANGLTNNNIQNVFPDSRGFLWISTEDGLNMYDGQSIKQFYLSDFSAIGSYNNSVYNVGEDSDHNILICEKEGIAKFNWATKKITTVYKTEYAGFGNLFPDLFIDDQKNIWVNERITLKKFDPHFHLIQSWNLSNHTVENLKGPSNTNIVGEDKMHNIWMNDFDSIILVNATTNKFNKTINTRLQTIFPGSKKFNCISAEGDSIWMVVNGYSLICINTNYKIIESFTIPASVYPEYKNLTVYNGKILLATQSNGVLILDQHSKNWQPLSFNIKAANMLSSEQIGCLVKDKDNNIWIGAISGLYGLPALASFFHQTNFHLPVSQLNQYTIHNIFIKGISAFAFTTFGALSFQLSNATTGYYRDKKHFYTSAYPYGNKWLISTSTNLGFYNLENGQVNRLPFISPHPAILDTVGVVAFFKDKSGDIWMGLLNDAGIVCWHTGNNTFDYYSQKGKGKNYCPLRHFKYATEDDKGNLWMGYEKGGIAVFNQLEKKFIIPQTLQNSSISNLLVNGIINDHRDHIWIATTAGLIKYNYENDSFQRLTRKQGLPSNNILGIMQDGSGNLWAGFEGMLSSINIVTGKIINYSTADGLPDEQFQNPYYDPGSKTMFFVAGRQIIYFNPQQVKKIIPVLQPVITSFKVMGKEYPVLKDAKIELPYSQNYVSFNFSAPNFINASENEYECKLDGADPNWILLGSSKVANYSGLQPGKYTFLVRARIKNGEWQTNSAPISINIQTPFWRTTWFWALCVLLFLSIIFLFIYLRLKNKFEKQILAQSIREKISGDLHDDIGSTLSSVSILSELAKQKNTNPDPLLERISENTFMMQENMNDIVWAINPKNDRFGSILQRMSQFAAEILEAKNIQVNFDSDESLTSLLLPMGKRKNFYLFFKEAINNCAKYSKASKVNISVSKTDHTVYLVIEDNGIGFDTTQNYTGNGMKTMKNRSELLNAFLQIDSGEGNGTIIRMNFKI